MSVILPSRDGAGTIAAQIAAVLGQTGVHDAELVVVDNGSTDDTAAIVGRFADGDARVRLVSAPDAIGLSSVRNVGVAVARGEFVAFCDDDDLVADGWLRALLGALHEHPFVASVMDYTALNDATVMRGRAHFQSARIESFFGHDVTNGAIGIRRDLWNAVGGNDETMVGAGEDFDFAIRVQRDTGITPRLAESAVYQYRQRDDGARTFRQAWAYGQAHVALVQRHGSEAEARTTERRRARRDWWWIVSRAPVAWAPARRYVWLRRCGIRLGRLEASATLRMWCP